MNSATFSASAPAITSMFPPTARDCSTSGGPRPCWPSCKPHDETSPHVREHRLYLLARVLTEPPDRIHRPGDGTCFRTGLVPSPPEPSLPPVDPRRPQPLMGLPCWP